MEVIPITAFSGHFARAEVTIEDDKYWIAVSLDHVSLHLIFCDKCEANLLLQSGQEPAQVIDDDDMEGEAY